jgi:hypothetical protein
VVFLRFFDGREKSLRTITQYLVRHIIIYFLLFFGAKSTLAQNAVFFVDVAEQQSINYAGKTFGSTWGDINGDGLPDLFISCHANGGDLYNVNDVPVIYYNNGGSFTADFILNGEGPNMATGTDWHGSAFFDVDRDGDLDMLNSLGGNSDNTFYLNENGLVISDLSDDFNLSSPMSSGRTPGLLDINGDGYIDIITNGIASAGGPPKLLLNNNGATFTDVSAEFNFDWTTSVFSTTTDLNNDGSVDLLSMTSRTRHQLLTDGSFNSPENVGANKVLDFAVEDFNNDLLPDIFHVRGDRGVYVEQINDTLVRANVNLFLPLDPVDFRVASSGEDIEVKVFPRNPNETYVVVVGDEIMEPVTGEITTLNLNNNTPEVLRTIAVEFPEITPRIYVAYDPVAQQWELIAKSGSTNKRPVGIDVSGSDLVLENNYPIAPNWGGELFYNQGARVFEKLETSVFDENDNFMSVVAADFDNDMDVDLYAVRSNYAANKQNILWENQGGGAWTRHEGAWGAVGDGPGIGENVTTVDYNNDGFMDIYVTNGSSIYWLDSARTNLYENQGNDNNWLKIDLVGISSNPMGLNSKVLVTAGGVTQMRYQNGGTHRFSQNDPRLHFGLAQNETIESVEVFWPSGTHQIINNVDVNQILTIEEWPLCELPYFTPENLGSEVFDDGVLLTWDSIPGSQNCEISVGIIDSSTTQTFFTDEISSAQFFLADAFLEPGQDYQWRVRCSCSEEIVGPFSPFDFFSIAGLSASNRQQPESFKVYPNPLYGDVLNIYLNEKAMAIEPILFDVQGRMIKNMEVVHAKEDLIQLDLSNLKAGVYILRLTDGITGISKRIIKQ